LIARGSVPGDGPQLSQAYDKILAATSLVSSQDELARAIQIQIADLGQPVRSPTPQESQDLASSAQAVAAAQAQGAAPDVVWAAIEAYYSKASALAAATNNLPAVQPDLDAVQSAIEQLEGTRTDAGPPLATLGDVNELTTPSDGTTSGGTTSGGTSTTTGTDAQVTPVDRLAVARSAFVTRVYQDLFASSPDASHVAQWIDLLDAGAKPPGVAQTIAHAPAGHRHRKVSARRTKAALADALDAAGPDLQYTPTTVGPHLRSPAKRPRG
jgi:hypothetical protein